MSPPPTSRHSRGAAACGRRTCCLGVSVWDAAAVLTEHGTEKCAVSVCGKGGDSSEARLCPRAELAKCHQPHRSQLRTPSSPRSSMCPQRSCLPLRAHPCSPGMGDHPAGKLARAQGAQFLSKEGLGSVSAGGNRTPGRTRRFRKAESRRKSHIAERCLARGTQPLSDTRRIQRVVGAGGGHNGPWGSLHLPGAQPPRMARGWLALSTHVAGAAHL